MKRALVPFCLLGTATAMGCFFLWWFATEGVLGLVRLQVAGFSFYQASALMLALLFAAVCCAEVFVFFVAKRNPVAVAAVVFVVFSIAWSGPVEKGWSMFPSAPWNLGEPMGETISADHERLVIEANRKDDEEAARNPKKEIRPAGPHTRDPFELEERPVRPR